MAGKAMTKSQITAYIAEKAEITKKQSALILDALAQLALKEAKNGFTLPGLGKVVLQQRKARKQKLTLGPNAGQIISIPAKKVLKFRFAKVAKDTVLGAKKEAPAAKKK